MSEPSVLQQCLDKKCPIDQVALQRTLEDTLFTYCEGMSPGERGMHWSFDWLFAPKEAVALAVGRFFERDRAYCYVALKHQSNQSDTRGTGVVYELRLPVGEFRYDPLAGRFQIDYEGPAEYKIRELTPPTSTPSDGVERTDGHLRISIEKLLWRPAEGGPGTGRRWSSQGNVELFESDGGARLCAWSWDYRLAEILDRPDYDAQLMLTILRSGAMPSKNGHFIPAMRASLAPGSTVSYTHSTDPEVTVALEGVYLDGNFARAKEGEVVTDRWGWMSAPQLWTVDGDPSEYMLTFGFFQEALIPLIQRPDHWSGAILWRSGIHDMTRFTPLALFGDIQVHFHSPRYLDITFVTYDKSHRVTVRAWSHTITTPMTTPSGREFQDHQDLLADAYVVVEENTLPPWQRPFRRPKWEQEARLITDAFGFEFGEKDRVIGSPGYPSFAAVPQMPTWFQHALTKIPDEVGHCAASPRLEPINR